MPCMPSTSAAHSAPASSPPAAVSRRSQHRPHSAPSSRAKSAEREAAAIAAKAVDAPAMPRPTRPHEVRLWERTDWWQRMAAALSRAGRIGSTVHWHDRRRLLIVVVLSCRGHAGGTGDAHGVTADGMAFAGSSTHRPRHAEGSGCVAPFSARQRTLCTAFIDKHQRAACNAQRSSCRHSTVTQHS